MQTLIGDVRTLIYGLRPPALDELGLAASLRTLATRDSTLEPGVSVDAPSALPELPAAVEVAAYWIAQEALTNVRRHAHARTCSIRVAVEPSALRLEIEDDGVGLGDASPGLGLHTMRERPPSWAAPARSTKPLLGNARVRVAATPSEPDRPMTGPIRIVVADDHPLFRAGLRALLESVPDTDVVGEAATGDEAVHAALSLQPDIVVMDINMPGLNGIDATRQIIDSCSDVHVLVMTMHDDDDAVFAAIRAGARGYLLKGAAQDETLRAIRSVANGEAIFGPRIAADLQRFLATTPRAEPGQAFPQLTDRELEILQLLAQRRSNAQIAA